jgi:hypothetical protein
MSVRQVRFCHNGRTTILSQSAIIIEYLARPAFVKKAAGIRELGISHVCGMIGILARKGLIAVPNCSAIKTVSVAEAELDLRLSVEAW